MDERLVLCVDDDELFLKMITSYLRAYGYAVVAETSGRRTIQRAVDRSFHAAILDCVLPDFGNGEAAIEFNQLQPETGIIILTGSKDSVPARVAAIADAVLSKEEALESLTTALERIPLLNHPRAVRKFVRYPVQLPFTLRLVHADTAVSLQGTATSIAEGGLGGRLDGEVYPGEAVYIQFLEPHLKSLSTHAQVRYRAGDMYGFEFLELNATQRESLRRSFEQLILN